MATKNANVRDGKSSNRKDEVINSTHLRDQNMANLTVYTFKVEGVLSGGQTERQESGQGSVNVL